MADIKEVKDLGKALGQIDQSVGELGGAFGQVYDQSKLIYDKYKDIGKLTDRELQTAQKRNKAAKLALSKGSPLGKSKI